MKNRKFVILALALLLMLSLPVTVLAAGGDSGAKMGYVTDSANILTSQQVNDLQAQAARISSRYGCSVYIVTVNDYRSLTNRSDIAYFCMDLYDGYNLGWGDEKTGTVLMLSMAERDYHLHFNSAKADEVFTERGRDKMEDRILPYLRQNDYYGGFREYLDICEEYLQKAEDGSPVGASSGGIGIFSAIPGAFAALFAALGLKAPMQSVRSGINANSYIVDGSLSLHHQSDQFLHRTVTRQRRQTNSGSSGGSSFRSGSHSGRSGKF